MDINKYFFFRFITQMGEEIEWCDDAFGFREVSFAKVHITKSVMAIYAVHDMITEYTGDKTEQAELIALCNEEQKKIRLFKSGVLPELFSKQEIKDLVASGILAPLAFADVVGMAATSARGDMPHVFTKAFNNEGLQDFISEARVSKIAYKNTYTTIDEEMFLPAVIKELEKLRYCDISYNRFSSRVTMKTSSSWEQEVARRWLMDTLNPDFPCFNLHECFCEYGQYVQKKIKTLEQMYYEEGVVAVTFYDVFGTERVFHAIDALKNVEVNINNKWCMACDLDVCCVSPAEKKFLKELTYINNGKQNTKIVPWSDIISIEGKAGKRLSP